MTDTKAAAPVPAAALIPYRVEKAPTFKVIHSNFYRYRIGIGDCSIAFGTVTDGAPGTGNIVLEEITVSMSWNQTKLLARTLNKIISIIEAEGGEIVVPKTPQGSVDAETATVTRQVQNILKTNE
jgi:hypothetical protein